MDLEEGARVRAYRLDKVGQAGATEVHLAIKSHKKLPRRVALLSERDRVLLDLAPIASGLKTRPVDVTHPLTPKNVRVTLEDETTPAPGSDAFRWFFYASSPPVDQHAPQPDERADAAEGLSDQAPQRLLVLHHLREHRRLVADRSRSRGALREGAHAARSLDALGARHHHAHRAGDRSKAISRTTPPWRSWTSPRAFPTGTCGAAALASGGRDSSRTSATPTPLSMKRWSRSLG